MILKNATIRNYRMLHDVSVNLEDDVTLIVGKNNCGKTSFFEVIKTMVSDERKLSFEDFSLNCYPQFREALILYNDYEAETDEEAKESILKELQEKNPKIELLLTIDYNKLTDTLSELSEFITDLDDARHDATILVSYESINTVNLYKAFKNRKDTELTFFQYLKENISTYYRTNCYAFDKIEDIKRPVEGSLKSKILKVVSFEEIKALRVLDDIKGDKNNTLGLGFANYYQQRDKTKDNVELLERTLKEVGKDLKAKYQLILQSILDDLKRFGAETPIVIPDIVIDSVFDSEAVIRNNIKYLYKQEEIDLPESSNGLGYSNLIYMVLEFASFIEKHKNAKEEKISQFLVVMIEEPEAHMHPQMQQVFIKQIKELLISAKKFGITAQIIITSHSSHIISEAGIDLNKGFNRIRYFTKGNNDVRAKDFNDLKIDDDKKTSRFLKQYLNLHKSDLFFADKVIMVEGITEKLLMPQMISKVAPSLQNEYITVLEVGGAYSHKFQEILAFIEIQTLLITDLDSVDAKNEACAVNVGDITQTTSNQTLIQWLPKKSLVSEIVACTEAEKIHDGKVRVAFQTNEIGTTYYPRSFEEAFIEKNRKLLCSEVKITKDEKETKIIIKNEFSLFKVRTADKLVSETSFDLAPTGSKTKTNFAFDVMSFDELNYGSWGVPHYIKEGLEWLAGRCIVPIKVPTK
jgi:putative ATP-dependent endonuclease of the OLD family